MRDSPVVPCSVGGAAKGNRCATRLRKMSRKMNRIFCADPSPDPDKPSSATATACKCSLGLSRGVCGHGPSDSVVH
jgi:hypothetical protein